MLSVRPSSLGPDGDRSEAGAQTISCPAWNRRRTLISLGLGLLAVLAAIGCAPPKYVLLRPSTVERYKLTAADLKSLQYYVDTPLELSRAASASSTDRIHGRLVTRHDITYEVVDLMPGSPCVATSVQLDWRNISISFQPGADLLFEPGSHKGGDCYVLRHGGPDSTHYRVYGGQTYTQRGTPRLMIERNALRQVTTDRESLPGRQRR
jgi:hypothetical protein